MSLVGYLWNGYLGSKAVEKLRMRNHIELAFILVLAAWLASCGGSGGDSIASPCLATEAVAANGAFIACDPVVLGNGPAFVFDLDGRDITYDGNRVVTSAFTMYSQIGCAGQVGIFDFQGIGVANNYGLSVDGDIYLSDGTSQIAWTRMSKVLNDSGTYVCSNESLGTTGPYFEAALVLDHSAYPTPYTIRSVR